MEDLEGSHKTIAHDEASAIIDGKRLYRGYMQLKSNVHKAF